MRGEPKLPKVGDVFIFSYWMATFSAKVTKITNKIVFFEHLCHKKISQLDDHLGSTIEWVPDPSKKYVVRNGYKDKDYKFSAHKTSFRSNGVVFSSNRDLYGYPWDGKPVGETHYRL